MDSSPSRIAETGADLEGALRVGRNFSFRLASQVISALINVAGMVLLANALAPGGYGEYAFYYALIPLIGSASDLGVGIIITREIARHRASGPRGFGADPARDARDRLVGPRPDPRGAGLAGHGGGPDRPQPGRVDLDPQGPR